MMVSRGPDFLYGSWSVHRFKLVHKLLPAAIPPGAHMPQARPFPGTAQPGASPGGPGMSMWAQQSPLARPVLASPAPVAGAKGAGGAVWSGAKPPSPSPILVARAPVPSWQASTVRELARSPPLPCSTACNTILLQTIPLVWGSTTHTCGYHRSGTEAFPLRESE